MLIEMHLIQNHSPANLNRDDLGAPKTCYFGTVLRSRISSQCIKRSIRKSKYFEALCGGLRTRQLAKEITKCAGENEEINARAIKVLALCGIKAKEKKGSKDKGEEKSAGLVYTTREAVRLMAKILTEQFDKSDAVLAKEFAKIIAENTSVSDMALFGRMLEPKKAGKGKPADDDEEKESNHDEKEKGAWKGLDLTVEAALQVAHAISTHEARPEVDYYVAADDIPGEDAGAGYVDEAMFASACFYKYFSIDWEQLVKNLNGNETLAAHTVGAFIRGAALANPTGKQNSFAAHNPPDGILVEVKDTPISYANAFARPVVQGERDLIAQSIAQLAQYVHDINIGYGKPQECFWFSPALRYRLTVVEDKTEHEMAEKNMKSLDDLIPAVVAALGHDWEAVQQVVCNA